MTFRTKEKLYSKDGVLISLDDFAEMKSKKAVNFAADNNVSRCFHLHNLEIIVETHAGMPPVLYLESVVVARVESSRGIFLTCAVAICESLERELIAEEGSPSPNRIHESSLINKSTGAQMAYTYYSKFSSIKCCELAIDYQVFGLMLYRYKEEAALVGRAIS
ncbi:hypothetical protein Q1695_003438 [Nippostrongylus brasiliensis]|nr:hypothetical protein Q1695_003438 [Nippostrongylus brasiliensis]